MTKAAFLAEYRVALLGAYDWARDGDKLDRFMASVERTITTEAKTWNHDSPVAARAWRTIGGKGKVTLKGLRALPSTWLDLDVQSKG